MNIGRNAWLEAGLPIDTPATHRPPSAAPPAGDQLRGGARRIRRPRRRDRLRRRAHGPHLLRRRHAGDVRARLGGHRRAALGHHLHAVGEGDVAHVLDAGADHDVVDAGGDQRRGELDGLLGGAALAVDRGCRGLDRQAGLEPGVAADVHALLAELLHAARDDVLDLRGSMPARSITPRRSSRAGSRGGRPCSSPSPRARARSGCGPLRR